MPRPAPKARAWTRSEDEDLMSFRRKGISFILISDHMKIPPAQLRVRARTLIEEGMRLRRAAYLPGQSRDKDDGMAAIGEDRRMRNAAESGSAALLEAIRRAHPERCANG